MLSKKTIEEIREFEEAGVDVVAVGSDGKLNYSTQGMSGKECCDQCSSFRLLPDPDPYDSFRDGDMKAVCLEVNGVIIGSLERPSEWTNIEKPLYCPKLGRKLTEEEKEEAARLLKWAKERMK